MSFKVAIISLYSQGYERDSQAYEIPPLLSRKKFCAIIPLNLPRPNSPATLGKPQKQGTLHQYNPGNAMTPSLRRLSRLPPPFFIFLLTFSLIPLPAHAVIVAGGDGTQNTTQGAMPNGWNNVGTVDGASAVYLGDGWVLTAAHVGGVGLGTGVNFVGYGTYHSDGQVVRLKTGSSNADLQMFHLSAAPNLPSLNIASSSPAASTAIYMAGYGRNRAAGLTYYSVTGPSDNPTWTELPNSIGANAAGYKYAAGNTKRWGTNLTIDDPDNPGHTTAIVNAGSGPTQVFFADFSNPGTSSEAQLANGDSGGGVFDSANNLIGLINYKDTFTNQPAYNPSISGSTDTAIFGNRSVMADLSAYRSQILAVIPEPSTLSLLLLTGGLILIRRRARTTPFSG
jgi:hypothetical protein